MDLIKSPALEMVALPLINISDRPSSSCSASAVRVLLVVVPNSSALPLPADNLSYRAETRRGAGTATSRGVELELNSPVLGAGRCENWTQITATQHWRI